jgi:hypothetical protein
MMFLLLVCLHLSWESSKLEDETRVLAEEIALLRLKVDELSAESRRESAQVARRGE